MLVLELRLHASLAARQARLRSVQLVMLQGSLQVIMLTHPQLLIRLLLSAACVALCLPVSYILPHLVGVEVQLVQLVALVTLPLLKLVKVQLVQLVKLVKLQPHLFSSSRCM